MQYNTVVNGWFLDLPCLTDDGEGDDERYYSSDDEYDSDLVTENLDQYIIITMHTVSYVCFYFCLKQVS